MLISSHVDQAVLTTHANTSPILLDLAACEQRARCTPCTLIGYLICYSDCLSSSTLRYMGMEGIDVGTLVKVWVWAFGPTLRWRCMKVWAFGPYLRWRYGPSARTL